MPGSILDVAAVREEIRRLKLTQRAFAEQIRMHPVTLSGALNGDTVRAETIYRIALGLELSEVAR